MLDRQDIDITRLVEQIRQLCEPTCIFLYGSVGRGEAGPDSDLEVGVVMRRRSYIGRTVFLAAYAGTSTRVYPFAEEDLLAGSVQTPFEPHFYARDLVLSARTIFGRDLTEILRLPAVTTLDALLELRFSAGRALSAILELRLGEDKLAADSFAKSFIYASRVLVLARKSEYLVHHRDILRAVRVVIPKDFAFLIAAARRGRLGHPPAVQAVFKNVEFSTQYVEPLLRRLHLNGPAILAEGD